LKTLKEGHQEYLLNTKYLRFHIMFVSKEELEGIKGRTSRALIGH